MKTILITGATAGFGEAAARKFVGRRLAGRSAPGGAATGCGRLQDELGDAFLPLEIDMRDIAAVESLAQAVGAVGRDRPAAQQCRPRPADRSAAGDRLGADRDGHRHQRHRARRADPRAPAQADRAQGADHQPVVGRRDLSVQGRRGLRRDQGVRPPILARPPLRPRRDRASA